jgi:glycosyltransferase involved in cell wall biosynthesis
MSYRQPKISVCIPTYNGKQFLPRAIESVLAQRSRHFELIVSDDASDDGTVGVCHDYRDPRLRVFRSNARLGQARNWNRCLELATGEYVVLLHADDELLPGYVERAAAILDANEDVGLVHCTVQHIDAASNPLGLQQLFDEDRVDRDDIVLRRLLLDGCVVNPAGVMVRREAFDTAGRFSEQIVWGVDWHMWIRVALRWSVGYLAEPLARYRQHPGSGTTAVMTNGRNARDERWAAEDLFDLIRRTRPDLYELKPQAIEGVAHRTWCAAETMCSAGDMVSARAGVRNAVRIWPRMALQSKAWGLWVATFVGYDWFIKAHAGKQRFTHALIRLAPKGR